MQFAGISGAYWVGVAAMAAAAVLAVTIPDLVRGGTRPRAAGPEPTLRGVAVSHAGVFLTAGAGILLLSALRASRQVVIPLWADHLGLDATQASLIYGLSGAIDMLVFYPAGKLMDRQGPAVGGHSVHADHGHRADADPADRRVHRACCWRPC